MALHLARAPRQSAKRVGRLVAATIPGDRTASLRAQATRPIAIYSPSPDALTTGGERALDDARRTGWRFLVLRGEEALIVDVPEGKSGSRLLRGGRMGEKLAQASLEAERIADPAATYEVRVLDLHPISE